MGKEQFAGGLVEGARWELVAVIAVVAWPARIMRRRCRAGGGKSNQLPSSHTSQ